MVIVIVTVNFPSQETHEDVVGRVTVMGPLAHTCSQGTEPSSSEECQAQVLHTPYMCKAWLFLAVRTGSSPYPLSLSFLTCKIQWMTVVWIKSHNNYQPLVYPSTEQVYELRQCVRALQWSRINKIPIPLSIYLYLSISYPILICLPIYLSIHLSVNLSSIYQKGKRDIKRFI